MRFIRHELYGTLIVSHAHYKSCPDLKAPCKFYENDKCKLCNSQQHTEERLNAPSVNTFKTRLKTSLCFGIIRTVPRASTPWRVINVLIDLLITQSWTEVVATWCEVNQ